MHVLKRRKFLKILFLGGGGALVAFGFFFLRLPKNEKLISSILQHDLKDLKISDQDIATYASDAARLNVFKYTNSKWKFLAVYTQLTPFWPALPWMPKYFQFRAEIVGNFLLSTGYFWNKMNETETVRYSGRIYTPYNYPCGNPFSNLFYPLE
jgi:hypothetical protein